MSTISGNDAARFRKALSSHGFPFQYAAIQRIISASSDVGWQFVGSEIPVGEGENATHADFLFYSPASNAYIVGECKKPDGDSTWLFARSAYSLGRRESAGGSPATLDQLSPQNNHSQVLLDVVALRGTLAYQVALATKGNAGPIDGTPPRAQGGDERKGIAGAVTQVLRAANGFMGVCRDNGRLAFQGGAPTVRFVPVVITTATLVVSSEDLHRSSPATGQVHPETEFQSRSWLWFEHPLSISMRAAVAGRYVDEKARDWATYFSRAAVRSVAIVNSSSIDTFVRSIDDLILQSE